MSEEFPTTNTQPNQADEWRVEDPQINNNGGQTGDMEQIDIATAAEITRERLVREGKATTREAYSSEYPEERYEERKRQYPNPVERFDAPMDSTSFVTDEISEPSEDGYTIKSSYIDGPNSSSTFEESAPARAILGGPNDNKRNHERTSTVTVKGNGIGMPGHVAGEDLDGAEAVYEEQINGKSSGRKINRKVTVGTDKEGGPVVRVELDSHGPNGPEDNPRKKVIGYGKGALVDKDGQPLEGVEFGEEQARAALKTAESIATRVAKKQPQSPDVQPNIY